MVRNTEKTRRLLKEAAVEEFAAHGLAGARVDRIAQRAGVNKERLYGYFGNKERLFAVVLQDELARIAAAVPLELLEGADIGEFAGHVFDYHADHPHLVRLLHWEGLAYREGELTDEGRRDYYGKKVEAFAAAQRAGMLTERPDAAYLVFLILSLAAWWFAVPQVARMLTGPVVDPEQERTARRAAVVEAARRLALPSGSTGDTAARG